MVSENNLALLGTRTGGGHDDSAVYAEPPFLFEGLRNQRTQQNNCEFLAEISRSAVIPACLDILVKGKPTIWFHSADTTEVFRGNMDGHYEHFDIRYFMAGKTIKWLKCYQ